MTNILPTSPFFTDTVAVYPNTITCIGFMGRVLRTPSRLNTPLDELNEKASGEMYFFGMLVGLASEPNGRV
jgi:hypothetical protein